MDALSIYRDSRSSDDSRGHFSHVPDRVHERKIQTGTACSSLCGTDSASSVHRVYSGTAGGAAHDGGLDDDSDVHHHRVYRRFYLYLHSGIYEGIS